MTSNRTLRQVAVAVLLLVVFLFQGTWALAGTTGSLRGTVTDDSGVPVAGVAVKAISASQVEAATTDDRGSFSFLNLAPDTYTVSVEKDSYNPISYSGVTIFADQGLSLSFKLAKSLKTIAKVTSRAPGNLVKSGTTSDVYSINTAAAKQTATAAGGYNLDSAYSAIASQPGVYQGVGSYNFGQTFYIRGSAYSQIGYEVDGIPVNRAFDNYNANSVSNLGAAETEVYTGGSPAGASSATLGGYVNQVIKSGTYPGFSNAVVGVGAPAFYHKLDLEAGGSNPNRTFSYYVGLRGANNVPNFISSNNGNNLSPDGNNIAGLQGPVFNSLYGQNCNFLGACDNNGSALINGPFPTCVNGLAPAGAPQFSVAAQNNMFGANLGAPLGLCNTYATIQSSVQGGGYGAYGFQI
ncbi:MAG: Plug and carboxypeptidase regulatory-like domain-containing protein, partial [Candidatus Eremiobacteraeota bacterium]|nr:Plug and carboxypeptidase regulatory-like domain-containing protein [Candidatus Eremiobacteraeota bacterium]